MMKRKCVYTAISMMFGVAASGFGQEVQLDITAVKTNLKKHITTLASDRLEGRETGTKGESRAAKYIISQFKSIGLEPKGEDGYLQSYTFTYDIETDRGTLMKLDGKSFELDKDFYPLVYSAHAASKAEVVYCGYGINAPELNYNDYAGLKDLQGKIFVMEYTSPDGLHPHSKYLPYSDIMTKIDTAQAKGAAAVILINSDTTVEAPPFNPEKISRITPAKIPVLFAKGRAYPLLKEHKVKNCELDVKLKKIIREGRNVIAYLDNKQENTVVIGAHYDHLGYGVHGSLSNASEPEIHNGADDNASGTATIIELARYLKNSTSIHNNYLFIAFSGEEKGLLGSAYYTKHPTIDMSHVDYMLNLDMVGRLKQDKKTLDIFGTGTSPVWKSTISGIRVDSIKIREKESGIGPSDYSSFYMSGIPVLDFFSGLHKDYHKPTDDEEKINYNGMISIMQYIITLIDKLDNNGKLAFSKTDDAPRTKHDTGRPRLSLGVVPDYMFEGEGMRIEGIASENKPGAKAGILAGDILIRLDKYPIHDMRSYMNAMKNFKKGESIEAVVQRGEKQIKLQVQF